MAERSRKIPSYDDIEARVRSGDLDHARQVISKLNRNHIPEKELARYANLANRTQLPRVAHRLLHGFFRGDRATNAFTPTEKEKIEFAEALRAMGLIEEAKEVLQTIDPDQFPMADLRMSFCLMSQWRYKEAIIFLKKCLNHTSLDAYQALVAKVNLAASLVIEGELAEAEGHLEKLKATTKSQGHFLLYGNCLELLAQIDIQRQDFEKSDRTLKEAESLITDPHSRYAIYIQKWKAIASSLKAKTLQPELLQCRESALRQKEWETVRECDLYSGIITHNLDLLRQVYFGTPYESYRRRTLTLARGTLSIDPCFIWNPHQSVSLSQVFDLQKGGLDSSQMALEPGQLMHRLFIVLASDFYRPQSTTHLFSALFPHEHYSQAGSSNRVVQLIKRLRLWLKKNARGIEVREENGNFSLDYLPGTGLRVPLESLLLTSDQMMLRRLHSLIGLKETITRRDIVDALGCSPATANRFLRWALEEKSLIRTGQGAGVRYHWPT